MNLRGIGETVNSGITYGDKEKKGFDYGLDIQADADRLSVSILSEERREDRRFLVVVCCVRRCASQRGNK
jgi:hypothetical protein